MQNNDKLQNDKDLIPVIIKLVELLEKYKDYSNIEIEIRLGYIEDDYFDTNITNEYYNKINNTLNSLSFKFSPVKICNVTNLSRSIQLDLSKKASIRIYFIKTIFLIFSMFYNLMVKFIIICF